MVPTNILNTHDAEGGGMWVQGDPELCNES